MGLFENFPYTNFHELNLDWILSTIKELDNRIDEFVQNNVLTYADPIQWNITTQYAKNTVVVGPDGTAYMSIAPVPVNILLTNTDYWQPIFNYSETVTVLKKQIAAADMGESKTALVSVPLGGLFWQLNTLYRAKKAISAGDGFVTGSNCELCTVEEAIKNVIAPASDVGRTGKNIIDSATGDYTETSDHKTVEAVQITEHTTANREIDVDGASSVHIDGTSTVNVGGDHTEVYAKTFGQRITGKRTVNYDGGSEEIHKSKGKVVAPDFELAIANGLTYKKPVAYNDYFSSVPMKDPDGNIYQVLVSNDGTTGLGSAAPYHSFKEFGIDNTGNTDCSDALAGVTDNVALSAGTYLIGKNCTITCELVFARGAVLSISEGVTVTITGGISANASSLIFTGAGSVKYSGIAFADWFGSITKAYASCDNIRLLPHSYTLTENLVLNRTNSSVIGCAYTAQGSVGTIINCGDHSITVGNSDTTAINNYARGITLANAFISGAGKITIDCALESHITNIYLMTSGNTGLDFVHAIYVIAENVYVQSIQSAGTEFFGFKINETARNDCASLFFVRCTASWTGTATHNNSYGFFFTSSGTAISDMHIIDCECISVAVGCAFLSVDSDVSLNLELRGCVFDAVTKSGYIFSAFKKGVVQITSCYCANASGAAAPLFFMSQSTFTLIIQGLELYTTVTGAASLYSDTATSVIATGLVVKGVAGGVAQDVSLAGGSQYDITYFLDETLKHSTTIV